MNRSPHTKPSPGTIPTLLALLAAVLLLDSCSLTKYLSGQQSYLTRTEVKVNGKADVHGKELSPYIKQKGRGTGIRTRFYWQSRGEETGMLKRIMRNMSREPVLFDSTYLEPSSQSIARRLEYLGYYNSEVIPEVRTRKRKTKVRYMVYPGKRYRISGITCVRPGGTFGEDFDADRRNSLLVEGGYLSEDLLLKESERSAEALRDKGYFSLSKANYFFEADTLGHDGTARLEMTVNEYTRNSGPLAANPLFRYTFGNVQFSYPSSLNIRESVLRSVNTIVPGATFSDATVANTYERLTAMRLFSGVNISTELSRTDSTKVDCNINLYPSKIQGLKLDFELSTNSNGLVGASPQVSYYHKNIFGGGEVLSVNFQGNFQGKVFNRTQEDSRVTEYGISTSLGIPRFLLLPDRLFPRNLPRTEISASFSSQDRPEYARNIVSTSYGYNGMFGNGRLSYQFNPLQINIVRLLGMDEEFMKSIIGNPYMRNAYVSHFDLGLGATLSYSTDRSNNPKGSYEYARFSVNVAGNLLSAFGFLMEKDADTGEKYIWGVPFSQYVRAEATYGRTFAFGKDDMFSVATRLYGGFGYAYGNSMALPFEQHFFAGGANSMRGWQARNLGPGGAVIDRSFSIPNQSGDMRLEANVEFRFPISGNFKGAVFLDAGNVWNLKVEDDETEDAAGVFRLKDFYKTAGLNTGFGIRYDLNLVLIRLDVGLILHDPRMPEKARWVAANPVTWLAFSAVHFGVGVPF